MTDKQSINAKFISEDAVSQSNHVAVIDSSFAQQRLWLLDQFSEGGSHYNIYRAEKLSGELDLQALLSSINTLIQRHEVLRTCFSAVDGQPMQNILDDLTIELPVIDLSSERSALAEQQSLQVIKDEVSKPFNLKQAPLFRARVIKTGDQDYILLLVIHHIIADGWSMEIINRELGALYHAYTNGLPSPLDDLPIQYADYALWQRDWLQGDVLQKQLDYWRQELREVPTLDLPTDKPRPSVQTFHGAVYQSHLPEDLILQLQKISQSQGATLFMTMLAAFQILLSRYTHQHDIAVGSPVAGRSLPEIENLIGFFVNTLVFRADLSANPSFTDFLQQVRSRCMEAYTHQDVPFEKLVEEIKPPRDMSRNPFFQVMLAFQNSPAHDLQLWNMESHGKLVVNESAKFDITVFLNSEDGCIKTKIQYNTDLYQASTIERFFNHYANLLKAVCQQPLTSISSLPILSSRERHQLLVEWNDTDVDYPADLCMDAWFERQVESTPDAIAIKVGEDSINFSILNEKANQLARFFRKQDIGADNLIGICLDRNIDMVISIMAVLKAGAAYVPLDPSYPDERLAYMIEDSGARIIITQQAYADRLQSGHGLIVNLDKEWQEIAKYQKTNLARIHRPEHLAYVIYTSGSTGKPKGVMIEHRNLVSHIHCCVNQFGDEARQGILATTSLNFDLSVLEIFTPLVVGGKIIMLDNVLQIDKQAITNEAVLLNTVPSVMSELLELDMIPDTVNTLILGGELLSQTLVDKIYKQTSINKIFDNYGPSEATGFSINAVRTLNGRPTIGRPVENEQVYILDNALNPVPIGVTGEIHIAGAGLGRGYLNQPALTAEKFIQHAFSDGDSMRLYKTGDLARYGEDGCIEYLGRIDHQVKIRGFRIELGEIETSLQQHPAIRESTVIARLDTEGQAQLLAYVVMKNNQVAEDSEIRQFIKQWLPDYMLPSHIVRLPKLPLMPNGKVDRNALPVPEPVTMNESDDYIAPKNPTEQEVALIWQQVLNLDSVDIHDSFFDIGGHSLLATRVISRIQQKFGYAVPLRVIFESPTIAAIAAVLDQNDGTVTRIQAPSIQPRGRERYKS